MSFLFRRGSGVDCTSLTHLFAKKAAATLPDRRRPPNRSEQPELFLCCVVKLFVGVHHVLMGLLNVVELLLLIRCEQRPNLRYRAVHYRFHFLHRLLMNGGDLRLGPIDNRLNLGLLVGRQVNFSVIPWRPKPCPCQWPPPPGPGCACPTTKP